MIRVGGRVVKTGIATGLSIFIARSLNLEPVIFAGLIATLSVQRSFYNSLRHSFLIVMSVLMGSFIGAVFAFSFGLHPIAVGVATIIIIIICLNLKWQDQIVLSVVTVITLMEFESQNFFNFTGQRILLGLIGASCGILLNIPFTPYHKKNVEDKLKLLDEKTREIMLIFAGRLNPEIKEDNLHFSCPDMENDLKILRRETEDGIALVKLLREEQRYRFIPDTPSEKYLRNFQQFSMLIDTLEDMNNVIDYITTSVPQLVPVIRITRLVAGVQKNILSGRAVPFKSVENVLENLEKKTWWRIPPECETEFFTRSALFHFFMELKKYYRNINRLTPFPGEEGERPKKKFRLQHLFRSGIAKNK